MVRVLAIVMTGMGSDGCALGHVYYVKKGQLFGRKMKSHALFTVCPMAIVKEKLADKIMSVDEIGMSLARH